MRPPDQGCNKNTDKQGTNTIWVSQLGKTSEALSTERKKREKFTLFSNHNGSVELLSTDACAVIKNNVMEVQCIDVSRLPSRSELTPLSWGAMQMYAQPRRSVLHSLAERLQDLWVCQMCTSAVQASVKKM
ncbi:TPA: hypothetical protein ACH3X2_14263 [Trebouxia sp. C0005]